MCEPLPDQIDAERLAGQHTRLEGVIPLKKMSRLMSAIVSSAGDVSIDVGFALDDNSRVTVEGIATVDVELACQRCLEPVAWALDARFMLALVHNEDETGILSPEYEPLLWPQGSGSLTALVEDELLLAMPPVPRHPDKVACGLPASQMRQDTQNEVRKDNPFSILEQLKDNPHKH